MPFEASHRDDQSSGPEAFGPELRHALARREPRALERFFDAYFERLYGFAKRMVRDGHVAEDLTQTILLRIHGSLTSYDPERALRSWVFTIAANVVRDHLRSRGWNEQAEARRLDGPAPEAEPVDTTLPSYELEHDEGHALVADAIESLPLGVRKVFFLRHVEELAFAEIARMLELTEPAARQRFSRAVRILRERFAPNSRDAEARR